ncbi:hypothetical protein DFH28DRAFT_839338, partial [Melampsora americana]
AGGIASGEAMRALSARWAEMDKSEKESYKKASKNTITDTLDAELTELDFGAHARDGILQPRTKVLDNPRCLKHYKTTAERLLDQTLAKV